MGARHTFNRCLAGVRWAAGGCLMSVWRAFNGCSTRYIMGDLWLATALDVSMVLHLRAMGV
eukprot:11184377-Lingulodinium_polyedra.AAC.1